MLYFIKRHKKVAVCSLLCALLLLACIFSRPLTYLALDFYDAYITPYNGECAYRVLNGGCSCSEYFRDIVDKEGVVSAVCAMPKQFSRCSIAFNEINLRAEDGERGKGGNKKYKWIACGSAAVCCGLSIPIFDEKRTSSSEDDATNKKNLAVK